EGRRGDAQLAVEGIEHAGRKRECRRTVVGGYRVGDIVIGLEAHEAVLAAAVDLPAAAQSHTGVDLLASLQRTTAQCLVGRPDAGTAPEDLDLFDTRAPRAVPGEPIERAAGDDAGAIDEAAPGGEVLTDSRELVVESPAPAGPVDLKLPDLAVSVLDDVVGPGEGTGDTELRRERSEEHTSEL